MGQERRNKIEQIIKTGKHRDLEARNAQLQIWRDILEQETNKLGIVCLSEKPDDILMWSHYSNKHCGYCLKFDKMVLERIFYCSSVDYRPVYPTFTDFVEELVQTGPNELHKAFLLTKSVHWEYEEEYRLMVDPSSREDLPGDRNYNYPEEALVAVIWGCQMSERDKGEVKKVLRNRSYPISYLLAKKSESAYEIKIEPA